MEMQKNQNSQENNEEEKQLEDNLILRYTINPQVLNECTISIRKDESAHRTQFSD